MENVFNAISRRSFLAELHKHPDLHPIIPLVEMIYSRDSNVYNFDPNDASLLYCTVQFDPYRCPTKISSWAAFVELGDQQPPSEYWGTMQGIFHDPSLTWRWKVFDKNAFCPDYDCGCYGRIGESLLEDSTNQVVVHGTPGYNP
jgi:hypothetical protein